MSAVVASLVPPQLPPGNFLDIPGCHFSRTGLEIDRGLKFDQWQRIGGVLRGIEGSIQFWIGDWIRYGEHEYGEKYSQAVEATNLDYQTLQDAVYVAQNVPISLRNENLSFSHHRAVASLPQTSQKKWLDRAEREELSYRELRKRIERAKVVKKLPKQIELEAKLKAHIEKTIDTIENSIVPDCPDSSFVLKYYRDWLDDLRFELKERGVVELQDRLLNAWEQGYRTDEALTKATGIPRSTIIQILGNRLGWEKVREGGKTEMARGERRWIWRKPGEALGSDARIPRAATEDDEDY